jgi:hypothetical protein
MTQQTNEEKIKSLVKLKDKRWEEYKKWVAFHCPALNKKVYFTVDGFYHLHTEPLGRIRTVAEQLHKFTLLCHAPVVVENCPEIITYTRRFAPMGRKKKHGKPIIKEFEYWSLKAQVNKNDKKPMVIKVILRKLVNSDKVIFWSIMG